MTSLTALREIHSCCAGADSLAAGIILPVGSDKFDKFRAGRVQSGSGRGLAALAIPLQ